MLSPMILCLCGRVHLVNPFESGRPLIECCECPPGQLWGIDPRYAKPDEVKIPRPEAVW